MAFDLAELFLQRQATATIRFARVTAVLKHFWDEEPNGFSSAEISDIEKRIDLQLPTALQEGLARFGHAKGMNTQDQFIKSSDIRRINGRITFRIENQGVCMWAVDDHEGTADPAVWVSYAPTFDVWFDTHNSVSEFFENTALFEATLAEAWSAHAEPGPDDDVADLLNLAGFQRLNTVPMVTGDDGHEERFFGGEDVLITSFSSTSVYVSALTENAHKQVLTRVPLNWTTP